MRSRLLGPSGVAQGARQKEADLLVVANREQLLENFDAPIGIACRHERAGVFESYAGVPGVGGEILLELRQRLRVPPRFDERQNGGPKHFRGAADDRLGRCRRRGR